MANIRYDRMAEEIKKTVSEIVREMKDPRITDMTTIMDVAVTNDLKWAKVKVSVYDKDDAVRDEVVKTLNTANGFIAREVGRRMDIRALPRFSFELDNSIEYSVHISQLIDSLNHPKGGAEGTEKTEE